VPELDVNRVCIWRDREVHLPVVSPHHVVVAFANTEGIHVGHCTVHQHHRGIDLFWTLIGTWYVQRGIQHAFDEDIEGPPLLVSPRQYVHADGHMFRIELAIRCYGSLPSIVRPLQNTLPTTKRPGEMPIAAGAKSRADVATG
jgi:hypothetical protein